MNVQEAAVPRFSRPSMYSIGVIFAACVLATDALALAFLPASGNTLNWISDVADVVGPAVILGLWASQLFALVTKPDLRRSRLFWVQLMLGLALTSDIIAQLGWSINEEILNVSPFPSWTDGFYLAFYVFMFVAILLLPGWRSTPITRLQMVIDGLAVTAAVWVFSWYYLIGPTVYDETSSRLSIVVATLYPIFDLVLLICLIIAWVRSDDRKLRRVVGLLTVSIAIVVVADSIFQYQELAGTYLSGSILDVSWVAADLLCGLAALALAIDLRWNRLSASGRSNGSLMAMRDQLPSWFEYLPYVSLPVVLGFFLNLWNTPGDGDDYLEPGVLLGCILLIGLVIVRQMIAIRENQRLHRAVRDDARRLADFNEELVVANDELADANQRLESLATTDPLTNLLNHRAMNDAIDREVERAFRYRRQFSLLFIDLDHFKTINDTYGHGAGDVALYEFAAAVQSSLRGVDVLSRWGGEEFIVLLPEIGVAGAVECAERIRAAIASHRFPVGGGIHITCSLGVATFPENGTERSQLIELADQAMYAAKRLGRNQVRTSGEAAISALVRSSMGSNVREDSTLVGVIEALATLVGARDRYTATHMSQVGHRVARLARELGLSASEAHMLGIAGLLHDIGKVCVPDAILQKPGHLSSTDWEMLRTHAAVGANVLSRVPELRPLVPIIRAHHERWDGSGYPDGLSGDAIPFGARMVAVVDAYGAMTSDRPYRAGRSAESARIELRRCAGTQFDAAIVDAFLRLLESEDLSIIDSSDLIATFR
ncbi:MAG: diguanylate cyclase [Nitrolancea sp.]